MYKDSLFELIRKEEVIIWAGSGLSIYAGFPSGQGLKFPNSEGISKLEFKSIPRISTPVDVRFHDGTEFTDIPVKLYKQLKLVL